MTIITTATQPPAAIAAISALVAAIIAFTAAAVASLIQPKAQEKS